MRLCLWKRSNTLKRNIHTYSPYPIISLLAGKSRSTPAFFAATMRLVQTVLGSSYLLNSVLLPNIWLRAHSASPTNIWNCSFPFLFEGTAN